MKKISTFLMFSALAVFALVVLFPSCTGPEGPAGADGMDGTDGVDANSFCVNCHTLDNKTAVLAEFATSRHGPMNGSSGYAGGRNNCTKCHSAQGNLQTHMTGKDTTATAIALPTHFKCENCHGFHMSLDSTDFPDYALAYNDPVVLQYDLGATTLDFPGTSNTCAYCHQPRYRDGFPIDPDVEMEWEVTSSHWGTHYGTQSVILTGSNGVEFAGSMPYESTGHMQSASCATCHMAEAVGTDMGGHTFRVRSEDGTPNMNGCVDCHDGATDFDINGVQTEIHALFLDLEHKLMDHKLIDDTFHAIDYRKEEGTGIPWTTEQAGAVFNFLMVEYDASWGVHNYKYTKAILTNTLEVVNSW